MICEKNTHVASRCVWPTQVKPIMQPVGVGAPELGYFMAVNVRAPKQQAPTSLLGLIRLVKGNLLPSSLQGGLDALFPEDWQCNVVPQGKDFLVQFPSAEKLAMLIDLEDFKLKGTTAYIKVERAESEVKPKGRMHTIWVRAGNVHPDLRNYKGICEVGSLLGAVAEVDMQSLNDFGIIRFKVHVKSVQKLPKKREYSIPPYLLMCSML